MMNTNTTNVPTSPKQNEMKGYDSSYNNTITSSSSSSSNNNKDNMLGLLSFTILVFYNVSGGPFGIETTVRAGGPLLSILGIIVFTFVWSIPQALVTAELGSTFPDASGPMAWVEEAFQKKSLSTFMGYVTWMSGAINNAIYPFILWEYLTQITTTISTDDEENSILTGSITEHHYQIIFILVISTILTFIAHRGIDIVSQMSLIICFVSISPFLFMSIIGLKKIELHRLLKLSSPSPINSDNSLFSNESTFLSWYNKAFHMARHAYHGVNWNPFLNNLFWNLTSFDAAASFSTEVHDIKNVYVRGIHWSILVVFLCYLVPLIVSLGAVESEQNDWTDGYLAQIGADIAGGHWLKDLIIFSAAITNISNFLAELSTNAYQLMGIGERELQEYNHNFNQQHTQEQQQPLFPAIFAKRSDKYDTPTYGLITCYLIIVVLGVFSSACEGEGVDVLESLIELLNFNYLMSVLLQFAAFLKLRWSQPQVHRPYKIPLGNMSCVLFLSPACITMLGMLCLSLLQNRMTLIYSGLCVVIGLAFFYHNTPNEKEKVSTTTNSANDQQEGLPNNNNDDDTTACCQLLESKQKILLFNKSHSSSSLGTCTTHDDETEIDESESESEIEFVDHYDFIVEHESLPALLFVQTLSTGTLSSSHVKLD